MHNRYNVNDLLYSTVHNRYNVNRLLYATVHNRYNVNCCSVYFYFKFYFILNFYFICTAGCSTLKSGPQALCWVRSCYYFVSSSAPPLILFWYWAIQAGLLTPLTFARHRLNPLAAFTSGAYFLHNGRRLSLIHISEPTRRS